MSAKRKRTSKRAARPVSTSDVPLLPILTEGTLELAEDAPELPEHLRGRTGADIAEEGERLDRAAARAPKAIAERLLWLDKIQRGLGAKMLDARRDLHRVGPDVLGKLAMLQHVALSMLHGMMRNIEDVTGDDRLRSTLADFEAVLRGARQRHGQAKGKADSIEAKEEWQARIRSDIVRLLPTLNDDNVAARLAGDAHRTADTLRPYVAQVRAEETGIKPKRGRPKKFD